MTSPSSCTRAKPGSPGKCVTSTRAVAQRGGWSFWKLYGRRGWESSAGKGLV